MILIKFPTIDKTNIPFKPGPDTWINAPRIDAIVPKLVRSADQDVECATIVMAGGSIDVFAKVAAIMSVIEKAQALSDGEITSDQFFAGLNELISYAES